MWYGNQNVEAEVELARRAFDLTLRLEDEGYCVRTLPVQGGYDVETLSPDGVEGSIALTIRGSIVRGDRGLRAIVVGG